MCPLILGAYLFFEFSLRLLSNFRAFSVLLPEYAFLFACAGRPCWGCKHMRSAHLLAFHFELLLLPPVYTILCVYAGRPCWICRHMHTSFPARPSSLAPAPCAKACCCTHLCMCLARTFIPDATILFLVFATRTMALSLSALPLKT
jgi:hypothetical protein